MPAPATIAEFLEVVHKSGILDAAHLEAFAQMVRGAGSLADPPQRLAEVLVRDGFLTQFQVQQLLLGKYLGFTIGSYTILELLGAGGMSAVYLCEDRHSRRRVALKVIPRAHAEDPALLKRFYREAHATAALDHPNIVRGYQVGQERNQHFFMMEYVEGPSLWAIVKQQGPLSILRACHYIRQAAQGLHYAHDAGLVHRDVKPSNLLIDRLGTVKILDLGLSRFENDQDTVLTDAVLGTLEYLAPEQAHDSHLVDPRADIYSLGGTFYFLLTGRPPFATDRMMPAGRGRSPVPLRVLRPEVPEALAAILAHMMAEEPDLRYQTAAAVAEELEPWTREPIPPPPEAEMPPLSPAVRGAGSSAATANGGPADSPETSSAVRPHARRSWLVIGVGLLATAVAGSLLYWKLFRDS